MKKCIVTVLGKDTVGIIAKVCTYLAKNEINILDISQTIVQGYFNMMMIVDVTEKDTQFTQICDDLEKLGKEISIFLPRFIQTLHFLFIPSLFIIGNCCSK